MCTPNERSNLTFVEFPFIAINTIPSTSFLALDVCNHKILDLDGENFSSFTLSRILKDVIFSGLLDNKNKKWSKH